MTRNIRIQRYMLIAIFLLATLSVLFIDHAMLGRYFFDESRPRWQELYMFRLYLTAAASFSLVAALFSCQAGKGDKQQALDWLKEAGKRRTFWAVMTISGLISLVFVSNPGLFELLRREDGVIENLSAILAVASGAVVWITAWRSGRSKTQGALTLTWMVLLGLVFFLIGMEEISWFQRILEINTPESFSTNLQREMNLHNFATDEVESAYYFGAFLLLVLIPFIHLNTAFFQRFESLVPLIPAPYIIFVGAVITAYNYDMWNILLTQYAFFMTVGMMAGFAWQFRKSRAGLVPLVLLVFTVLTQGIYLLLGQNYKLIWHITEYKEFLIPLAFLVYAAELNKKLRVERGQSQGTE